MKSKIYVLTTLFVMLCTVVASAEKLPDRALWASINGASNASLGDYQQHTGKVLVSWRMLPGDNADTGFDLYRTIGTGAEKKIASSIKNRTCYQDGSASKTADNHYRLTYAGSAETLSSFTLTKAQVSGGLPYISIPLADTKDVYENTSKIVYTANDVSIGDLKSDAEAWAEAEKVQNVNIPTAINNAATYRTSVNSSIYNLSGQRVDVSYKGILIKNGKKVYNK